MDAYERTGFDEVPDPAVGDTASVQLSARDQSELTIGESMDHLEDVHLPRFLGKVLIVASAADRM